MALRTIMKGYTNNIILALICSTLIVITTVFIPIYLGLCFESIEMSNKVDGSKLVILFALYAGRLSFKTIRNQYTAYLGTKLVNEVRNTFTKLLLTNFSVKKYKNHKIYTTMTYDLDVLSECISWRTLVFLEEGAILIISCIKMLRINTVNPLIILASLFILSILYYKYTAKVANDISKSRRNITNMTAAVYNNYTGQEVLRAFNAQNWQLENLNKINKDNYNITKKLIEKNGNYLPDIEFLGYFIVVINILISSLFIMKGMLSLSALIILNSYAFFLVYTVRILTANSSFFIKAKESIMRVSRLIDEYNQHSNDDEVVIGNQKISKIYLKNFSYQYDDKTVFDNVNLCFEKSKTYLVKGEIGCGKSTLLNILSGIDNNYSGNIYIDDLNLKKINQYDIMSHVSLVSSESNFFNTSFENNLVFGNENMDRDYLEKVIEITCLNELVSNQAYGLETEVSKDNITFSGGEKQRIMLARALLKNADILLIDDSLNAIDEVTLVKILENIKKLKDKIIIIAGNNRKIELLSDVIYNIEHNNIQRVGLR